jgi:hypothetical protein
VRRAILSWSCGQTACVGRGLRELTKSWQNEATQFRAIKFNIAEVCRLVAAHGHRDIDVFSSGRRAVLRASSSKKCAAICMKAGPALGCGVKLFAISGAVTVSKCICRLAGVALRNS